ncbi:hypothetical protein M569_08845, partial [Genlisea aurea]
SSREEKLKALRDLKNQIIGNRTKKLVFLKLGAVPAVVAVLSASASAAGRGAGDGGNIEFHESILIQSAAVLGSFACGLDSGVKAVLDAGAFPLLLSLISYSNDKIADAGARSLKMIYQSKSAPKFDFLLGNNMEFLLSLLNSENENLTGLGASIVSHSCQQALEQQILSESGVIKRLVSLLGGSLSQKDASLESLAAIVKNNPEITRKFLIPGNGGELNAVIELIKYKHPRTRLLACTCLVNLRNSSAFFLQDSGIKNKLVLVLSELMDDLSQVGDEAPFVLSGLISEKENMQKLAFEANVIEKLSDQLSKGCLTAKRLEGILLALADLCSKLECCREKVLDLKVLDYIIEALAHDSSTVRVASCTLLKNVARSIKNLSAGHFMNDKVVYPLVQCLSDCSVAVQVCI